MKIGNSLYFDHQATTPLDPRVFAKMRPYLEETVGNPHSSDHVFGWRAAQAVEEAATQVANLIGSDMDEIIFTSGATEANNLALLGLTPRHSKSGRNRIILSSTEHKSILSIGRILEERCGYKVDYLSVDEVGHIDLKSLENRISNDVLAVSIMAVNNEIGVIQNINAISEIAKKAGVIFHCDAAQAPCSMDLSNIADQVDLLSLSAHKMYGPQGVGVLYINRELHGYIEPIIYGGGQQNGLRSGTIPVAQCLGMGEAARILFDDNAYKERLQIEQRRNLFVNKLHNLSWNIRLNGPELEADRHPGNANLCFHGFSSHDILGALQPKLAASTGSACTTGVPEPSHVLREIGLSADDAESSIRFSIGRYTTDNDIVEAIDLIDNILINLSKQNLMGIG